MLFKWATIVCIVREKNISEKLKRDGWMDRETYQNLKSQLKYQFLKPQPKIPVVADSILPLTQVPVAGYELRLTPSHSWLKFLRLDTSCCLLCPMTDLSLNSWIQVTAYSIYDWLESPWLDTTLCWFHPATDSSYGSLIRVAADSILWLTWVPQAGLDYFHYF